jgi:hypothetical protein
MRREVQKVLFTFIVLLLTIVQAHAAPRIFALFPTGGQRGTTVSVMVQGEGLKEMSGFFAFQPGVTAKVLPGGDDKTRTVELSIAKDAALGNHILRFYDGTGLSNPRYFRVGQWAEVLNNRKPGQVVPPMPVTLPVTVNGRIAQNPDRDGYTFHAKAGQSVVCEIEGLRVLGMVGDSWLKGYMEITDAKGKVLASSNGTSDDYYRWDPMIVFTPPAEGDYTVWFRDLNWRGDVRSVYRLNIGVVPHAVGVFPLGGQRGTTVPVSFAGPNCEGDAYSITVPKDAGAQIEVARPGAVGTTNARPFQVGDLPEVMQTPGNQTLEKAQVVPFPSVVNGRIAGPGGQDCYRIKVEQKQKLVMEVFSRRLGTPMDPEMSLFDAKGNRIQADDDGRGIDCWIYRELEPGEYTVVVRDLQDRGGPEYGYRLSIAPPVPLLNLFTTPDAPTLARGKSVTMNVRIAREYDWNEDVTIALENPPPGVAAAPLVIPKGKSDGQLTLNIAADAPPGPVVLRVIGTAKVGERNVRALSRAQETYNIQGTAFQRDLPGPVALITEK